MEFEQQERRHVQYIPRIQGEKIFMPLPLCHSRGSGDIRNNEVRSLAKGMGLSENHFKRSVRCDHERECDLLCLATRLLTDCESAPQVAPPNVIIPSVEKILAEVERKQSSIQTRREWKTQEREALEISKDKLQRLAQVNQELRDVAFSIIRLIDRGMEPVLTP